MKYVSLKYIFLFLVLATVLSINAHPQTQLSKQPKMAHWTIMIYAQADHILNNFAIKNFNAIAKIGSNENLNIIVQWNQPRKKGMWRYKIDKNHMTLLSSEKAKAKPTFSNDIIEFADFTIKNYPAKKYGFVFWNHGVGVIDPEWNQLQQFAINPTALAYSPRIQIAGITKSFSTRRGILFDIEHKTYMNNQELDSTLAYITQNILHKKFHFVGMDACLMAMLGTMYQIKDYAKYFVSSEEVELAQGWNYPPFLQIAKNTKLKTKEMINNIVMSYESYYKNKTQFYTQSAVKLEELNFLRANIDHVVNNIGLCSLINKQKTEAAIQKARKLCLQFSTPCYIDLHSFYSELHKQFDALELLAQQQTNPLNSNTPRSRRSGSIVGASSAHVQTRSPRFRRTLMTNDHANEHQRFIRAQAFKDLQQTLADGIELINHIVLANVTSKYLSQARGISIYYPSHTIDPSYLKTKFAQESLWLDFLETQTKN